jgi:TetR/AcrR family tetracycline transcriptional repressor
MSPEASTGAASRPMLNRPVVVGAALAIVDRDGLDKLTMRALGRELGADPMAAYHYVPNKTALLDSVVEAVWAELVLASITDEPWQDQLRAAGWAILATLRRHPRALPIMASRPNVSAAGMRMADHVLGLLTLAGLPPQEALLTLNSAGEYILGHALAETGALLPAGVSGGADVGTYASAAEQGSLPHLQFVLAGSELNQINGDRLFDNGLDLIIKGIEAVKN